MFCCHATLTETEKQCTSENAAFHALVIADTGELLPESEPIHPHHGTAPCGAPILEVLEVEGFSYREDTSVRLRLTMISAFLTLMSGLHDVNKISGVHFMGYITKRPDSGPVAPIQRPILNRLGQVLDGDIHLPFQIGDCSRHL